MPRPRRMIGTASHDCIRFLPSAPLTVIPAACMSGTRQGSSVSMTRQLALGPRLSRWPSASEANGPTAARMTSSSPWTSAMEPPVNAVAVRSRSSVSWRM